MAIAQDYPANQRCLGHVLKLRSLDQYEFAGIFWISEANGVFRDLVSVVVTLLTQQESIEYTSEIRGSDGLTVLNHTSLYCHSTP